MLVANSYTGEMSNVCGYVVENVLKAHKELMDWTDGDGAIYWSARMQTIYDLLMSGV